MVPVVTAAAAVGAPTMINDMTVPLYTAAVACLVLTKYLDEQRGGEGGGTLW